MNLFDEIRKMQQEAFEERSRKQMNLGELIKRLKDLSPDLYIEGLDNPHSYRGYYSDFAMERKTDKIKCSDLLTLLQNCMGQVFVGYKGGDFIMYAHTPVWIADYGDCGDKLMKITDEGKLITEQEDFND